MSFFRKFWRVPALALVVALPIVAACADDQGAAPPTQTTETPGSISGKVTSSADGSAIVGALVGTSPATSTALTDAQGNYQINNVPISGGSTSYAVTASKEGFTSASTSVTLTTSSPSATANLALGQAAPGGPTTGDLNVLVTNKNGEAQSGAAVSVKDVSGTEVASATTDATGFALFSDVEPGSYTVSAAKTISGIPFQASSGVNVKAGETAFAQLVLGRDFGQSVFPNIDGESVTLGDGSDIAFVPVPGGDSNPEIDCNVIRTQHMYIVEVTNEDGDPVSGVKVQWDLNISENGTITIECPDAAPDPAGCKLPTVPGNTGSVVDSDDPDLNPATARTGLQPSFNVDTRKAVTFTNDNAQTVSFGSSSVTVDAGQTWIVITSPVEGITDVVASTPDIPKTNPNCANDDPNACDKEFAIKRWVNWDIGLFELDWPNANVDGGTGGTYDPNDDPEATFTPIADGSTVTNVLDRRELANEGGCAPIIIPSLQPAQGVNECELTGNRVLFYGEVARLRDDSPFNISSGTMVWDILDDQPDVEFFGEDASNDGDGCSVGVCNVENNGPSDDEFTIDLLTRDHAEGEFDANNNIFDGGTGSSTLQGEEDDFIGWNVVEARLNPAIFFCDDVDFSGECTPGAVGSPDTFSTAYQRLVAGTADNQNTIRLRVLDEFGEVCGEITFNKRWVTSRLTVIKNTPDATRQDVEGFNVKRHTIQVGQTFSYTVTAINDGEVRTQNVRITDTLPRFGDQFSGPPDLGAPSERNGSQAFVFLRDRPAFDPNAVVYGIDTDDDDAGDAIDVCIRGDDGTVTGNAYVEPSPCGGATITDAGTVQAARDAAIAASDNGDQVVWIQWFDVEVLARTEVGGGIQSEDSVEIFLSADSDLYAAVTLPGTWCNIATVTDGPLNLTTDQLPQSFDADTLCHQVREALLDVRKTARDAVISATTNAVWDVEIQNAGSATLTNVVIRDTLDSALAGRQLQASDVTINTALFPTATVTVNPDGFTFSVNIGDLPPTIGVANATCKGTVPGDGFCLAYTVSIPTAPTAGVFCNRVTATGQNPAGTLAETDISCITTTVAIEIDIQNEDGFIDAGGVFQSSKETFTVGNGGTGQEDSLAYQVIITNQSQFTATGVKVIDEVAPNSGIIEWRATRSGFPTKGTVSGTSNAGFTWNIGTLAPMESAEIQFRAEAVRSGDDVNRVNLTADQLTGTKVNEEPTTVSP